METRSICSFKQKQRPQTLKMLQQQSQNESVVEQIGPLFKNSASPIYKGYVWQLSYPPAKTDEYQTGAEKGRATIVLPG
ncbi:hypothetical protein NE619_03235 [Anaerovorax odorimutans]|uniref:Uncharacterized protein n=1 Tax=Anaerovorax odorimutans TaxID=109327 RepID=A0ABT1RKM0_9FIRM|nr:hypothetical protein [Anaerovorax odorimutans]